MDESWKADEIRMNEKKATAEREAAEKEEMSEAEEERIVKNLRVMLEGALAVGKVDVAGEIIHMLKEFVESVNLMKKGG